VERVHEDNTGSCVVSTHTWQSQSTGSTHRQMTSSSNFLTQYFDDGGLRQLRDADEAVVELRATQHT
jgi:hypothetical protein